MDSYYIKLDATHSHVKMRLAEIRFDIRQTVRSAKVLIPPSFLPLFLGSLRTTFWLKRGLHELRT